jgi:predicted transcriptional regulator of viral defense system
MPTKRDQILGLVRRSGVLRPRDLKAIGVSPVYLNKLYHEGVLVRSGRGLYTLTDAVPSSQRTLAEVGKRYPHGVICLLSALQFHGLTSQAPFEVWLALERKSRRPKVDYPPLRVVRFSPEAMDYGVEEHDAAGVTVRVFSAAKTVADCFKYRNKIGLDVAIESLRDCLRRRKATMDELWAAAKVCRMINVMRPYLEAMA